MELEGLARHDHSTILVVTERDVSRFKPARTVSRMMDTFPSRTSRFVVTLCSENNAERQPKAVFDVAWPTAMNAFLAVFETISRSRVPSKVDHSDPLLIHGPTECGGTWSMDLFRRWQQERIKLELEREIALSQPLHPALPPNPAPSNTTTDVTTIEQRSQSSLLSTAAMAPQSAAPASKIVMSQCETIRLQRRRALDRIRCKRKREKRRQRQASLEAEYSDGLMENIRLKSEARSLLSLLRQARVIVDDYEKTNK